MKLSIIGNYVKTLRERLSNSIGLPFQDILSQDMIEQTLKDMNIEYRQRLYDPIITLWAFICQVLDDDKSCSKAVSRINALLADRYNKLPSADTGAYCKARKRLNLSFIISLLKQTGQALHHKPTDKYLWCNKRVFLIDGSSLSMADTQENKQKYSQQENQHEYVGFPVARIVAIFCLHTGAIIDAAIDSLSFQEITLFRRLYPHLKPGDVALGDRAFGSYADICLLLHRGVDSVFRIHASRKVDFSKGKSLSNQTGHYDHIVYWNRPKAGTLSLEPQLYEQLPDRIELRELRFYIHIKGFRTKVVTLVTTLLDHKTYTYEDLAQLYGYRWQVEIDLRHLKTTMKMDFIKAKSPQMVEKEFYVHLLAYNLIRSVLWDTCIIYEISSLTLSFKGAIQYILSFLPLLAILENRFAIYMKMLSLIAQTKLPERPFRIEPRVIKKRPKAFPMMKRPRQELRQQLLV